MKLNRKTSKTLSLLTSFSILFSLCAGIVLSDHASAQTLRKQTEKTSHAATTPALSRYARNLTAAAGRGELSPAASFSKELRRTTNLLARDGVNPV
ncbi:MAG: hypothetical protein ACJ741_06275, partial [Pyrinomonadaceae bacterium]